MKVIMPAGDVPRNAVVVKVGGTVKYTLSDSLTVYYPNKTTPLVIDCDKECLFLIPVNSNGKASVNAISLSKDVIWEVSENDLYDYLYSKINDGED